MILEWGGRQDVLNSCHCLLSPFPSHWLSLFPRKCKSTRVLQKEQFPAPSQPDPWPFVLVLLLPQSLVLVWPHTGAAQGINPAEKYPTKAVGRIYLRQVPVPPLSRLCRCGAETVPRSTALPGWARRGTAALRGEPWPLRVVRSMLWWGSWVCRAWISFTRPCTQTSTMCLGSYKPV